MKSAAFTLAELLIAITLLGVIAAFSLPKILQAVGENHNRAILTESLASVYDVLYAGRLNNAFTPAELNRYLISHLNIVRDCPTNASTEGCWDTPTQGNGPGATPLETNEPGLVFASGATLAGLNSHPNSTMTFDNPLTNGFVIDANGTRGPNRYGQDQLALIINYGTKEFAFADIVVAPLRLYAFNSAWCEMSAMTCKPEIINGDNERLFHNLNN